MLNSGNKWFGILFTNDMLADSWLLLVKIGFLPVRIWDILDILIVGYLMYQIYRLLKGNIAFNILIGVVMLFFTWELVKQLEMVVLETALERFASVGVIIIAIIFQQEIRRFLLLLGNTTLKQRGNFLGRLLDRDIKKDGDEDIQKSLLHAVQRMSKKKIGALIVFTKDIELNAIIDTGVTLDALISQNLVESIFAKTSPLHDGAMLIHKNRIVAASCILPVSENMDLPTSAGLRHRAALGVTERFEVTALVVSEENGYISYAKEGLLRRKLTEEEIAQIIETELV